MPLQHIPLDWALNVTAGAVRHGASQNELLSQSYIQRRFGDERDRVSHAQYILLCMNAAMAVDDALQGLGLSRMEPGFVPLTMRIVEGGQTLQDAIHALSKFFRLAGPSLVVNLRVDHDEAAMTIHAGSQALELAYTLESNHMGWLSMCLSHFLGRPVPLTGITTRDPNHISLDRRHWSLGAPVTLGAVSALRFPASVLSARRARGAGHEAFWYCIRTALYAAERDPLTQWVDREKVSGALLRLNELARRSGVSSSTMGRRFEQLGGFRQTRRRTLVEAAVGMLKTSDASVDSIAMDFGYADARSFRRFLKSATGKTPDELRESKVSVPPKVSHEPIYRRIRELTLLMEAT